EQVDALTATRTGRYAVRVERTPAARWELQRDPATGQLVVVERSGLAPTGTRPLGAATLPALESTWELRPRLFVQVTDFPTFGKGRIVFRDFQTPQGSIPILADAQPLSGVGVAGPDGGPQPYTAAGAAGKP